MNRIALVTGANQGMGKQVAKELVSDGVAVFVGSRDLARGEKAAAEIGDGATALQLDVTDAASIARAAERIQGEAGRLDLLVNNAGISTTRTDVQDMEMLRALSKPSVVPLDEVRAVWEVNVFGALAVCQAMLPLLRKSSDARIVNVTSAQGSLTTMADPAFPFHPTFEPVYSASKTALNAVTLSMMIELEATDIKVNLVSPGFANTALVKFEGTESVEDACREVVRVARLGPDGPTG
ncbi:SDR family NAD(P)-dependent oxidoreductase, partial [Phytoactinopolyspora endophytica]|uniref:SDR family NAD(P)-dependent oxidoreductase n=1 Tax=Phytoactinopolyspora endophytica TaxID=1642495 RepID=UPI00101B6716